MTHPDATERTLTQRMVIAALENSAGIYTQFLSASTDPADAKHWKAELNAVNKATWHYLQGVRPEQVQGTRWLVPSGTRAGVIHQVVSGACGCEGGLKGATCWHVALVAAAESAVDMLDMLDSYVEAEPDYDDSDFERDMADVAASF